LLARHQATAVFLDASFDVVVSRIAGTGNKRPLASDLASLRRLYEQRRPTYLLAAHTFDASQNDPSLLLTHLVQLANRLGFPAPARDKL
jgi:shikimate kinase